MVEARNTQTVGAWMRMDEEKGSATSFPPARGRPMNYTLPPRHHAWR